VRNESELPWEESITFSNELHGTASKCLKNSRCYVLSSLQITKKISCRNEILCSDGFTPRQALSYIKLADPLLDYYAKRSQEDAYKNRTSHYSAQLHTELRTQMSDTSKSTS